MGYLAGESDKVNFDKRILKLIEELESIIKDKLYFLPNAIIRGAKIKHNFLDFDSFLLN